MARKKSPDLAVFVTARKLAHLIDRALRWGQPYIDEGAEAYEARFRQARVKSLQAQARELGGQLVMPVSAN